ncbi:MAG: rhodanese-related sulfurtransferase [Rhizobiales bacterium]|nr:rhodanese-related sulfurtransferase [Hyphomicrobiales bacterium]
MSYKVAAFYQFVPLPDFEALREPLRNMCAALGIKGIVLLAAEGINGTVAGSAVAIDALINQLRCGALFGGRLDNLELKFSAAAQMPFQRLKVRLKKEIVMLRDEATDPNARVGTYVEAQNWNELIARPDVVLLDTRNQFEVEMGTFAGATDPKITSFSQFKDYADRALDPARDKAIAMFCTGGIRCEKASSYLLARGFAQVYHLKGGILKYLEEIPEEQSRWQGECFVFDQRIALGHGLVERAQQTEQANEDGDD